MRRYCGEAIRFFREQRRLGIERTAEKASITGRQLYNLEKGSIPRADTLGRLADALGVGVEDFFRKERATS